MSAVKPRIETAQAEFELERLLALVQELAPARILEVGTWHGGTLWHWLQTADTVVSVDDTMFEGPEWLYWADLANTRLHLVQGDSHDPETVAQAAVHAPYEFAFIDAGHDYASVQADWLNYGPLVAEGGLVAFHDIQPRDGYGVSDLWAELKPGRQSLELWAGREAYCGIGVLWV